MDTYMRSKLYAPSPGDLIVPRQQLFAIMDSVFDNKTVFISAPAGYGKTTTITAWLKERSLEYAWISLDEDDDSPARLLQYLCATVGRYLPDSFDASGADHHALLDKLLYALQDGEQAFALVLDDFHFITDPQLINMVLRFMQYKPPHVYLVIAGREAVPGKYRPALLKQQMVFLRDEQLLFSKKETHDFFQLRQLALDAQQIDGLWQKTEGWPCALVALSLAVSPLSEDVQIPSLKNNSYIHSFLRNEVWERWDRNTQAFLLQTAILNEFSVPLAHIVTQMGQCHDIMEQIRANRGFLITLDAAEGWYRYHHVFRQFLRELLEKDKRYDTGELQRRAAGYYRDTGDIVRALSFYTSAKDHQGIMDLIESHSAAFLYGVDFEQAIETIDALAPYGALERLRIGVCYGWALEFTRQYERAGALIQQLKQKLKEQRSRMEPREAERIHIEICALSIPFSIQSNNYKKMLYHFWEVLKRKDVDTIIFNPATFPAVMGNKFTLLDTVFGFFGRLSHYMRFTRATVDIIYNTLRRFYKNVGSLPVARAEILYQQDRIDEALPYLCQGVEESDENGLLRIYIPAMLCLANIQKAKGDIAGAYHTIDECCDRLTRQKDFLGLEIVYAYKARLDLVFHHAKAVKQWEKQAQISPYDTVTYHALYQYLTLAQVLIQTKRRTLARLLLEKIELFISDIPAIVYAVRVHYLSACLALGEGDRAKAKQHAFQALSLGCRHGYCRIFADEGEAMQGVLDMAEQEKIYKLKNGPTRAYLEQVREATKSYIAHTQKTRRQDPQVRQGGVSLLTPRETDILIGMSKNFTNQEIADQLFVSLQTVKNHTSSIYRKLGVSSRMQAVSVAKKTSILP